MTVYCTNIVLKKVLFYCSFFCFSSLIFPEVSTIEESLDIQDYCIIDKVHCIGAYHPILGLLYCIGIELILSTGMYLSLDMPNGPHTGHTVIVSPWYQYGLRYGKCEP